eukprot:10334017-Alexandrium_andersonii.AAC.1
MAPVLPGSGGRYQHARSSGPVSACARIHTRSADSEQSRKVKSSAWASRANTATPPAGVPRSRRAISL